jgi:hypothetical protein
VEEVAGGGQDLLGGPVLAAGVCDGGDERGPGRVGDDTVGGGPAEQRGQQRGPGGSKRGAGVLAGGGERGGGEVAGEPPPQRGGGLFVGERPSAGDRRGEVGDV